MTGQDSKSVSDFFREWGEFLRSRGREVRVSKTIGRLCFTYRWRSKDSIMGRFGGGWNWKIGVSIGGATVILDILVFSIVIQRLQVNDGRTRR